MKIKLAISTCPNDTFAFHAILNRKIDFRGLDFQIELLDIQQLNAGLMAGRFDIAKASFHAALQLTDSTVVLPAGSALGFGVGPLLLAAEENSSPAADAIDGMESRDPTITLCPGELTTATLLLRLFYGPAISAGLTRLEQCVFSGIMSALQNKTADFGVCIHEGRFTWREAGLFLVEDLGTRWEQETGAPLPLGGILARRDLDAAQRATAATVIRESIEYGLANRDETIPTMRRYAQEFTDAVLLQHVDLYVNDWTVDLGDVGRQALQTLAVKATECGLVLPGARPLEVLPWG